MVTIEDMVQREVLCCMSSMVSTLAAGGNHGSRTTSAVDHLMRQATELAAPVLDYEEAATQAWTPFKDQFGVACWRDDKDGATFAGTAEQLCDEHDIPAYEWEVYEHWAVTQWLAEKLQTQGERVDTDFAGLNIWARTTTGQAIGLDGCIQRIYADMTKPCVAEGEARVAPHTLDSVAPGA